MSDTTMLVASLTGFAAGDYARIDDEMVRVVSVPSAATIPVPVIRGQEGTNATAHPASARVIRGVGTTPTLTDWPMPPAGAPSPVNLSGARRRTFTSYSAAGAIALPTIGSDACAFLNGTTALAMTLADPSTAQDGDQLWILGNGKAAHTVTLASGAGNVGATADVFTFKADQAQGVLFVAIGGFWVNIDIVAGAATVAGVGVA